MSQNNETAAIVVYQTNPVGVEPFSYEKTFFYSNKIVWKKNALSIYTKWLGCISEYQEGRERWWSRDDKGDREGIPHNTAYSTGNLSRVIFNTRNLKGD